MGNGQKHRMMALGHIQVAVAPSRFVS